MSFPLVFTLLSVPGAAAALLSPDASFDMQTRTGFELLRLPSTVRSLSDAGLEQRLEERLGWYGVLEAQPAVNAARMSALIAEGVKSGEYRSLILGETHSVDAERAAARQFMADLFAANAPIGSFLLEARIIYPDTSAFDARGIPVLIMKHRWDDPDLDVADGLAKGKGGMVVTYSGSAHSAQHPKNYFQNTLLAGTWAGYGPPPLKDMATYEDGLTRRSLKPLIVSMVSEAYTVGWIQQMFLKDFAAKPTALATWKQNLEDLQKLWTRRLADWPKRADPIVFVRDPQQPNLYAGLTPADRRPLDLVAASRVLALPEVAAWLGAARISGIESLPGSATQRGKPTEYFWDVIVHSPGLPDFKRTLSEASVSGAAAGNMLLMSPTPLPIRAGYTALDEMK